MHKFKALIKTHKEIFSFALFAFITLIILAITLILVRTNQDTRSRAASSPCSLTNPILIDNIEQEYMQILNSHRESLGKGPLRISENLTRAAQWQAEDMAENNYFNHIDSLGRNYQQRATDCGINTSLLSENIANGQVSARAAFDAWQASTQGHKANMEDSRWTQTGIARVASGGQIRWAQTFSVGNDGTSPELEDPNTPTATPTNVPNPTATPTGTANPTLTPDPTISPSPTGTPSPTPDLTPPANPKKFDFSFRIPGIGPDTALGQNPNPVSNERYVIFAIVDSTQALLLDFRFATAEFEPSTSLYKGSVELDEATLLTDNFVWIFLTNSTVHKVIVQSLPQNGIIPTLLFRLGDFNLDEKFDLNDYIDMTACIKKVNCFGGEELYDLNSDGLIDSLDLNLLYSSIKALNP